MQNGDLSVATCFSAKLSIIKETQILIYSEPITAATETDLAGYRFISVQKQPSTSSTFTKLCTPISMATGFLLVVWFFFFQSILPVGHTADSGKPLFQEV